MYHATLPAPLYSGFLQRVPAFDATTLPSLAAACACLMRFRRTLHLPLTLQIHYTLPHATSPLGRTTNFYLPGWENKFCSSALPHLHLPLTGTGTSHRCKHIKGHSACRTYRPLGGGLTWEVGSTMTSPVSVSAACLQRVPAAC